MPNRLFDQRSQEERTKYFERGASLELESDVFESVEAQAMLNRESKVLDKHLPPKNV
jgi:predicted transglutaminase-like protease